MYYFVNSPSNSENWITVTYADGRTRQTNINPVRTFLGGYYSHDEAFKAENIIFYKDMSCADIRRYIEKHILPAAVRITNSIADSIADTNIIINVVIDECALSKSLSTTNVANSDAIVVYGELDNDD